MKILAYCLNAEIICADHASDDTITAAESADMSDVSSCTTDDLNPVESCGAGHNFCGSCGSHDIRRFGFFHACQDCTMTTFAPDNDDQFVVDDAKRLRIPTGEDFVEHDLIIGSFLDRDRDRLRYAYQLVTGKGDDTPTFYGTDFCTPRHTDPEDAVMGLLSFLSLRPGDTDAEYFENYTTAQMSWCERWAKEVGCLPYDHSVAQEEGSDSLEAFDDVTASYGAFWEDFD